MATLYVENVPDDRYEALKARATENKRSITAEILNLLEHSYPTPEEHEQRFAAVNELFEKQKKNPGSLIVVLDASVPLEAVVPGSNPAVQDDAQRLILTRGVQFIAPDFFWLEIANVLSKAARRTRWTVDDAENALVRLQEINVETESIRPLMREAFRLSLNHQLAVYDTIYVALAIRKQVDLITADLRLYNALGSRYPVRWLGGWIARR
jgi:predicted nucleic acid-binding protein/plasmid stability protein